MPKEDDNYQMLHRVAGDEGIFKLGFDAKLLSVILRKILVWLTRLSVSVKLVVETCLELSS